MPPPPPAPPLQVLVQAGGARGPALQGAGVRANLPGVRKGRACQLTSGLLKHVEMPQAWFSCGAEHGPSNRVFSRTREASVSLSPGAQKGGGHGREPLFSVLPLNWDTLTCLLGMGGQGTTGGLSLWS